VIVDKILGIHNTVNERDIPNGALQDAIDVDITNAGGLVARPGYQLALSVPVTTAYTTLDDVTYLVSEGSLKRVGTELSLETICPSAATEFADYQRYLFTNDGKSIFETTVTDLYVPVPQEPEIVITGGTRPAGLYNIVTTFINESGLEGGTSPVVTIELTTPGEILITPEYKAGYQNAVYMTEAGGEVYYHLQTGRQLIPAQMNANPFPQNAEKIEYFDGRVYVSERMGDHTIVWFSKPYQHHLFGVDDGYFIVPGRLLDMRATKEALIIGTDKAVYGYVEGSLDELAKYGVVPGRPIVKLPDGTVRIHTVRGVCSALPFTPLTEDTVSLYMGSVVSAHIMYHNGIRKYVALHDAGEPAFNSA
jgi:hypothetical protein